MGRHRQKAGKVSANAKAPVLLKDESGQDGEGCLDSADADLSPGRSSASGKGEGLRVKKANLTRAKKRISNSASKSSNQASGKKNQNLSGGASSRLGVEMAWRGDPLRLPPEVLLQVFTFAVDAEDANSVLPRVSRVCKEWRDVAGSPCLLRNLDLSGSARRIRIKIGANLTTTRLELLLSSKRDLSKCESVSLAGQINFSPSHITSLLAQTPRLKSLDMRKCAFDNSILTNLPQLCSDLERFDLCRAKWQGNASREALIAMVSVSGPRLVELRLGGLRQMEAFVDRLLEAVSATCPLLRVLDVSLPPSPPGPLPRIGTLRHCLFNMGALAKGCPMLAELRLDGLNLVDLDADPAPFTPGFQRLKVLSLTRSLVPHEGVGTPAFYRMFCGNDLDELNVSQSDLGPHWIVDNVRSVKKLGMADMPDLYVDFLGVSFECLYAWVSTLEVLDLSGNKIHWLRMDLSFFYFTEDDHLKAQCCLRVLNLAESCVTPFEVLPILQNCRSLQEIDLSSCQDLPSGCRRKFVRSEFSSLMHSLQKAQKRLLQL